jgi:F-type H+-transporting ATPase subunit b
MYALVHLADVSSLFTGLGINALAFLSQLVSFGIVFVLLWKWGFPLILRTLDRRQAVIREGIENAEKAKTELEEATVRAEEVIAKARRQAQETIEQAQKAADRESSRILEENRARLEQLQQQEIARIQQEAARARAEISRLVVNLSIDAAAKVIGRSINDRDNRRLVEEFVSATEAKEQ